MNRDDILSRYNAGERDFSGADLSEANLSRADLSEANLSEANLSRANLSRANLSNADLSRADLSEANLSRADLSNADLSRADLSRADLSRADLSRADLSRADLSEADLSEANLSRADLSNADLSRANLSNADLSRADLSEANLSNANLSGAKGVLNPIDWIERHFEQDAEGVIVFKTFNNTYRAPAQWKIEPGTTIEEVCNLSPQSDCASGINVATLAWIHSNMTTDDSLIWKCRIRFEWLIGAVVPYHTDGKFRTSRLELLHPLSEEEQSIETASEEVPA